MVRPGWGLFVLMASLVSARADQVVRGPYLQNGSSTNIVIRWRTDVPTDSRVWLGTSFTNLAIAGDDPEIKTEHEINVHTLTPDTAYFYAIGSSAEILAGETMNHFFITASVSGAAKPTRIWVLGDSGTANANAAAVRDAYYEFTGTRHTDLWLMLGDNAYEWGTDAEYQAAVFEMYPDMLQKSVLWPTRGNHEITDASGSVYYAAFTMPKNGEAGGMASGSEAYYSFDYGNIHFICLDSQGSDRSTNGPMAIWLQADLAATTADWIIAFWHHPPYSKGSHDSDHDTQLIEMRARFLPILEGGGVDVVLTGHSHSYERSLLLDGHYGFSATLTNGMILDPGDGRPDGDGAYGKPEGGPTPHQGAVYAVVGCSGTLNAGKFDHPAMFIGLTRLGSMVLDIDGNRLDATFLRANGSIADYFTILKTNYPPVVSNLTVQVTGDSSATFCLSASDVNSDALVYSIHASPTNGILSGLDGSPCMVTYKPAHGYSGRDELQFLASDGLLTSAVATVSFDVLLPDDSDTNGIPDDWEDLYQVTDANSDSDGDGLTDLQEYRANTNPTNAGSSLRIVGAGVLTNGQFRMSWLSVGGTRYRVGYSDGTVAAGFNGQFTDMPRPAGEEISDAPAGSASTNSFIDDFPQSGPPSTHSRYYRVRVVR